MACLAGRRRESYKLNINVNEHRSSLNQIDVRRWSTEQSRRGLHDISGCLDLQSIRIVSQIVKFIISDAYRTLSSIEGGFVSPILPSNLVQYRSANESY